MSYALIHAPFTGMVQRLESEVGELAMPGKALLELVATQSLRAVFSVPQKDIIEMVPNIGDSLLKTGNIGENIGDSLLKTGDAILHNSQALKKQNPSLSIKKKIRVKLIAPFLHKTMMTHIDHIYPALDNITRNATFDVHLATNLGKLRPGMTIDAIVIQAEFKKAIVLPAVSIRIKSGQRGVYVVEKNIAHWRSVGVGQAQGKQIRIVSGLKSGEIVVITPDSRLQNGSRVRSYRNLEDTP